MTRLTSEEQRSCASTSLPLNERPSEASPDGEEVRTLTEEESASQPCDPKDVLLRRFVRSRAERISTRTLEGADGSYIGVRFFSSAAGSCRISESRFCGDAARNMMMDLRLETDLLPEEKEPEATRGRGLETLDCQAPSPHLERFTSQEVLEGASVR
jgi:hypothetical protein